MDGWFILFPVLILHSWSFIVQSHVCRFGRLEYQLFEFPIDALHDIVIIDPVVTFV